MCQGFTEKTRPPASVHRSRRNPGSPASRTDLVDRPAARTEPEPETQFDIELSEVGSEPGPFGEQLDSETDVVLERLSTPKGAFNNQLLSDALQIESRLKRIVYPATFAIEEMGKKLCCLKYKVHIRRGLGLQKKESFSAGSGFKPICNTNPECLEVLRHEFLIVEQVVTGIRGRAICSKEIIVQPEFRSHFMIPVMTERYKNILQVIPKTFVGDRSQLRSLVGLICDEMEDSFKAHHRDIPPWRLLRSTLSKWCPKRYEEFDIVTEASLPVVKKKVDGGKKLKLKNYPTQYKHSSQPSDFVDDVNNAQMNGIGTALAV